MPEVEFNRKWEKQKKWIDDSMGMGNSEKRAEEIIYRYYYPQYLWKYNQIVGFVEIAIGPRDVSFNVQKTLDKRLFIISKTKHFIEDLRTGGKHFPIGKMSNEEILTEIEEYLDILQNDLSGKMCLCLDNFNTVKKYIDFLVIHAELISD